ncbi:MAG: divergent polysaccharide deacetylase family protein [Thermoanaerobaculia bacterium]
MIEPTGKRRGPFRRSGGAADRPPFHVIASTIGLPLIAFLMFAIYQWVSGGGSPIPETVKPLASAPATARQSAEAVVVPRPAQPQPALPRETGRIVLILDDVGYDPTATERAAALPATINFAVIPGTPHAKRSAEFLASRGFEILCHLPMEPVGYPRISPGDGAILLSLSDDEIRRRTTALFRQVPHAIGVNNHMGSAATADARVMRSVLEAVRDEGVFFVDSRTSGRSVGHRMATDLGIPSAGRDVFLDDDASVEAIRAQVQRLAQLASANEDGVTIAIGHLYPSTLQVLSEEIPKLRAAGFRFLPVSAAVTSPSSTTAAALAGR